MPHPPRPRPRKRILPRIGDTYLAIVADGAGHARPRVLRVASVGWSSRGRILLRVGGTGASLVVAASRLRPPRYVRLGGES